MDKYGLQKLLNCQVMTGIFTTGKSDKHDDLQPIANDVIKISCGMYAFEIVNC